MPSLTDNSATSASPTVVAQEPSKPLVEVQPLTLAELVDNANRIFVGSVVALSESLTSLTKDGKSTIANVRTVTIHVTLALKGNVRTGETLTVRQLASISEPLSKGQEVLWYLASDSELGLTQPLGIRSGDFRITTDEGGGKRATNLFANEGLWKDSLWSGRYGFDKSQVLTIAKDRLRMPTARLEMLEQVGSQEATRSGVPLDLLTSATAAKNPRH
jgi:hypothetical protein